MKGLKSKSFCLWVRSRSLSPYLIVDCSIRDVTGRFINVQEDHWHPLTDKFSPQPGPEVSASSCHQHLPCGDALGQRCLLSQPGGQTLLAAAAGHHGPIQPVADSHSWARGNNRHRVVDPRLVGEVGAVVHVMSTGLQTTKGDTAARKLLQLAQRAPILTHVGTI